MTTLSYFILVIALLTASLAIYHIHSLKRRYTSLPLRLYLRAIWGIGIITLIQVGETVVYVIYGYQHTPPFFRYFMFAVHITVGLLRISIPFDIVRFFFALFDRKYWKGFIWIQIGLMTSLFAVHIWVLSAPDARGYLYRYLLHIPRFFFSMALMGSAVLAWRWIGSSKFKSEKRSIRLLSLFLSFYAFALLSIRFMTEVSLFFYFSGSTLRILVAFFFYLFHLLFAHSLIKSLNLYREMENNPQIEKIMNRYQLTQREMQILKLIEQGKTNREIAEELGLSAYTIRDHCSRIMQKTGLRNRTQLVTLRNSIS